MKLFHGTNVDFEWIDLAKCPPQRDFGQGFYLTRIRKHARKRAEHKVRDEGGVVKVIEYEFDLDIVISENPDLRVKRFEVNGEWARFVMYNRMRKASDPPHDYDIVEGPVANDDMFQQFRRYVSNDIGLAEFVRTLTYREATHQMAFCSERSLRLLIDYISPPRYKLENTISELSVALMRDRNLDLLEAMRTVYDSSLFSLLTDYPNRLYRRPWPELYERLKLELS